MKILQLDLIAFGPFSGERLSFGDGTGLHLVYGANEAGKSSALRALRHLLWGIPAQSKDNFRHSNADLRIGATLASDAGGRLEVVRRKGNKNTLRAADDERVVDEQRLLDLLRQIDRTAFERRHAIDYQELEQGGQAVAEGQGDLATLLFTAGSGIADLGKIRARLDEEARELFKSGGSKPRINATLAEWKRLKERVQESRLRTADWSKLEAEREANRAELERVRAELAELRADHGRRDRMLRAIEPAARRARLQAELAELQGAALLPDDAERRRLEAQETLQTSDARRALIDEGLAKVERAIEELPPSDRVSDLAQEVERLSEEVGGYKTGKRDRETLEARKQREKEELLRAVRELWGPEATLEQAAERRISTGDRRAVEKQAAALEKQRTELEACERRIGDLQRKLEAAMQACESAPPAPDAQELEAAVRAARKSLPAAERLTTQRVEAERLRRQAERAFAQLGHWDGGVDELLDRPAPLEETIDRWERTLGKLTQEAEAAREACERAGRERERAAAALADIDAGRPAPTVEELDAARRLRTDGWRLVRGEWELRTVDEAARAEFVGRFPGTTTLAEAYGASVEAADRLADRLRDEADRAANKENCQRELRRKTDELQQAERKAAEAAERTAEAREGWRSDCQPTGVTTLEPAELRSWLGRVAKIRELRSEAARLDEDSQRLEGDVRRQVDALLTAWRHVEPRSAPADGAGLADLVEQAEDALAAWRKAAQSQVKAKEKVEGLQAELTDARRDQGALSDRCRATEVEWRATLRRVGLADDSTPEQAREYLQSIDAIQKQLAALDELHNRVTGIDARSAEFERGVATLLQQCELAADAWPAEQAPGELLARLNRQRSADSRRQELEDERKRLTESRDEERAKRAAAESALERCRREAGVDRIEELPAAERRSARLVQLRRELEQLERELAAAAAPEPADGFVEQVLRVDRDRLASELEASAESIEQAVRREQAATLEQGALETRARAMSDGDAAVQAESQMQQLIARLQDESREYARLRLAETVLARAVERHRERSQGPLVRRAGELFAELTLGAYSGLRADVDEGGRLVLFGIQAGSRRTTPLEGLSTGTRDQLYLALRLASLEQDADRHESLPLVIDDILIQFDDARAAAALRVLAQVARRMQVVYFTHHAHLIGIARQALDASEFHEQTLQRSPERAESDAAIAEGAE